MLKSYYPHTLLDYDLYLFPEVSQYKILNLWLSITLILFPRFIFINVCCSLAIFGNTPKSIQRQSWMSIKRKNQLIMVCNAPTFKRKRKKQDIKLRGIQVVLYLDHRGHVKQKSDDFSSNWLDVFFNLTKGMIGSLLSDQFQNIELDSKLYSLENQYLCFYVSSYLHWWLCIRFLKLRLQLTLTFDLETSFLMDWCILSEVTYLIYY